jgi:hypothetical protein
MKRSNYHILHALKTACPKLRKAVFSNSNKDLLNDITDCILNVLNGNIKLSDCSKRKLRKHKSSLPLLGNKRLPVSAKKPIIIQHGGFLLPLLTTVLQPLACLFFRKISSEST